MRLLKSGALTILFLSLQVSETRADSFADAVAAFELGEGERAAELLRPLANAGQAKAQSLLGLIYRSEILLPTDVDLGLQLIRQAAYQGDAQAQYTLGLGLYLGEGMELAPLKAIPFLKKSAQQGHPQASTLLGTIYLSDSVVKRDLLESDKWLTKAIFQRFRPATFIAVQLDLILGQVDHPKDLARRLKKYEKHGNEYVQGGLGLIYLHGLGVHRDEIEALKWLTLAAFQGTVPRYTEQRNALASSMTPEAVAKAEEKARKWLIMAASDPNTYIGFAAKWCHQNQPGSFRCLKQAINHHMACLPPYFPGFFENFYETQIYRMCRTKKFGSEEK